MKNYMKKPENSKELPVFVINLKERTDRLNHIKKEFNNKSEFELRIYQVAKANIATVGLWENIIKCIDQGIKMQHDIIIICEDDHSFTELYKKELLYLSIIEAKELNADILLGGVSWFRDAAFSSDHLIKLSSFSGTQFLVIFKKAFFNLKHAKFDENTDTADSKICEILTEIFCIYPLISIQKEFGYSDVTAQNNVEGRVSNLFEHTNFLFDNFSRIYESYKYRYTHFSFNSNFPELEKITIPTYVINLRERKERRLHIQRQFSKKKEFSVTIVDAIKHEIGAVGLWLSIRKIIQMAVENDDDVIVICEDDHQFENTYSKELFFKNVIMAQRLGIEYLSCGCSHFEHTVPVTPNLYWVSLCQATQMIVLYKPAFQKILDEPYDNSVIADLLLSEMIPNKMILYPAISVQKDFGYSDVTSIHNGNKKLVTNMFTRTKERLDKINEVTIKSNYFATKT